ncbi:DUF3797 domain-containing protein [Ectobacillus ponti]|uniref:DUF3797 domain-containing protein n=1 Tax=Ectobacillus ponti TaxID=2961894 RepID=A0AA41XDH0_9BACI|nr:DUF3797 domain-containing protein [Ectobacillus ponti]MCP8971359.1 DUF3797 domain-containing protein [Ectobacillus ponti]
MDIIVQTFPMKEKTLYYVQCPVCKKDRILNSISNVSYTVSEDAFRKLCGCICKSTVQSKREAKPKVQAAEKPAAKRKGITALIAGREMTVKEIADTYGISQATVRQRINAGKTEAEIIAPTKKTVKN